MLLAKFWHARYLTNGILWNVEQKLNIHGCAEKNEEQLDEWCKVFDAQYLDYIS